MKDPFELEIPKNVREKAEAAKRFIQKKYSLNQLKAEQRLVNWKNFQERLANMQLSQSQQLCIKNQVLHEQMLQCRRKRQKISKKNFQSLTVIGRGAFGEVRLCRQIKTGRIVAIKCLKKKQMIKKNQQTHLRDQRDILADGSQWIVKLLYSFQDQANLYLVMQYLPGGDLMTLLIDKNVITQQQAKFYVAQTLVAVDSVHKLNFIHRDLKPDNILIDIEGHIKLSDFGLCKQTDKIDNDNHVSNYGNRKVQLKGYQKDKMKYNYTKMMQFKKKNRKLAYSAVGTPDYIAPQMLTRQGYNETVDWWSVGIMLYQMLIGYAPFSAQNNEEIYFKIQNHQDFLHFPAQVQLSQNVIDLISKLLSEEKMRLGKNGVEQIQRHPWFQNINWAKIKQMKPPLIPNITSQVDTKYFDAYEEKQPWLYNPVDPNYKKDFNFIGYTFKDDDEEKTSGNIYDKALQKAQGQRQEQIRKEKQWLDYMKTKMKKKKNFQIDTLNRMSKQKTFDRTFCTNKSQLQTQRSRRIKSKSPLAQKSIKIDKQNKKKVCKSPIQTVKAGMGAHTLGNHNYQLTHQKSSSYLASKKPQVTYSSTIFQQNSVIGRKSLNNRK